jgi:beta-glucosidase/6-phospho-beta-glucosidase/beta-galactosidase
LHIHLQRRIFLNPKNTFLSLAIVMAAAGCSKNASDQMDASESDAAYSTTDTYWGFVTSTAQLVRESVDPEVCESGWTALVRQLGTKGEGALPPLQTDYVTRFETLDNFSAAAERVFPLIEGGIKTLRISLMWPCWTQSESWRTRMASLISELQTTGYTIELMLSHHDSYPIMLHDETPNFGIANSGWANDSAPEAFASYAWSVVETLGNVLPQGTRVYLVNEPVGMLMNSYLGTGSWPPGGKRAGTSFAKAMLNMRDGIKQAAEILADIGWETAVAKNIRPVTGETQTDKELDFVFNWWLLDALVYGCIDDNFDQFCETDGEIPNAVDVIGMTFYGTMHAGDETVELRKTPTPKLLHLPVMSFVPDASDFDVALRALVYRYQTVAFTVAEIGLSSGKVDTMTDWLLSYRDVLAAFASERDQLENAIGIHTLFESAEFTTGEWHFHAIEGKCLHVGQACTLTPWGRRLMEITKH